MADHEKAVEAAAESPHDRGVQNAIEAHNLSLAKHPQLWWKAMSAAIAAYTASIADGNELVASLIKSAELFERSNTFPSTVANLRAAAARIAGQDGVTDQLRSDGWAVAVHNDYRLNGEAHTFWLFTKGGRAIKGEGRTDGEALAQCLLAAAPKETR